MAKVRGSRLLEGDHFAPRGVHTPENVLRRAILAGGVDSLKDN
jgi:hypothetical protein